MSELDLTGNPGAVDLQDAGGFQFQEIQAGCPDLEIGVHDQHRFRPAGLEIESPLQKHARKRQVAVGVNQDIAFTRGIRIGIGHRRWRLLILGDEEMIIGIRGIAGRLEGAQRVQDDPIGIIDSLIQPERGKDVEVIGHENIGFLFRGVDQQIKAGIL